MPINAEEANRLSQLPPSTDLDNVFEVYCLTIRDRAEKKQRQVRLTIPDQLKSEMITRFEARGFKVVKDDYEVIVSW